MIFSGGGDTTIQHLPPGGPNGVGGGSYEWSCGPELVIRHGSQVAHSLGKEQIP